VDLAPSTIHHQGASLALSIPRTLRKSRRSAIETAASQAAATSRPQTCARTGTDSALTPAPHPAQGPIEAAHAPEIEAARAQAGQPLPIAHDAWQIKLTTRPSLQPPSNSGWPAAAYWIHRGPADTPGCRARSHQPRPARFKAHASAGRFWDLPIQHRGKSQA